MEQDNFAEPVKRIKRIELLSTVSEENDNKRLESDLEICSEIAVDRADFPGDL